MSIAQSQPQRGDQRLLERLLGLGEERPSAYARLEDAVGDEFARLLMFALSGPHGRLGSSSP